MISWSTRHRFFYIAVAVLFFLFVLALPVFFLTYTAPSCTDGKQNQNELGVDCGGKCSLLCKASALDLTIHWQRAFKVKDGIYNALAYVENPNLDSDIDKAPYVFKFYDKDNLLIYEKKGETFVPAQKEFGIFESNINMGTRVPARTFFEFLGVPAWKKNETTEPQVIFSDKLLSRLDTTPRFSVSLLNRELRPIYNIEVVAIVYDISDNALASSRTIVDTALKGVPVPLVFTWPEPFVAPATRIELLYRVLR